MSDGPPDITERLVDELRENLRPDAELLGWDDDRLDRTARALIRNATDHGVRLRETVAVEPDTEYRPPSIANGTVSEGLVNELNHLVAEYGHEGVRRTLAEMTSGGLVTYMGTDALRWAQQFCSMHGGDEGLMIGWFANAIMAGHDEGRRTRQPIPTDLGWDVDTPIDTVIGEAVGAASMCWERPEDAGVFESDRASGIVDAVMAILRRKQWAE